MRCPRCSLAEISEATETCPLCGYSAAVAAVAEAPSGAATELDARRELSRDFRLEAVVEQRPGLMVYLARDRDNRVVKLKAVSRAALRARGGEDRMQRAAEAAAALDHPHIIPVYGSGAADNWLWYATKHVEGRALDEILRTAGPIELGGCLRILEQAASAMDYAHRRGTTHGGLTPARVIIDANGWVLLADFTVAGVLAAGSNGHGATHHAEPTAAADQHALAALAWECLTGTPPSPGGGALTDVRPEIPTHVSDALRRALSPQPSERFPTVLDFVAALGGSRAGQQAWFARPPRRGPGAPVVIIDFEDQPGGSRRWIPALVGLVIALAAGGVWFGLGSAPPPAGWKRSVRAPAAALPPPASLAREPTPAPPPASIAREQTPPSVEQVARPSAPQQRVPSRPAPERALAPAPTRTTRSTEPAVLSINAIPWGNVYLDGRPVGNTPLMALAVPAGTHRLRVEREGFLPHERTIEVAPGQRLRLTDIVLREVLP